MAEITRITEGLPTLQSRKRVAAYARISMETERMNHSLSAQVSYYNDLIQKNPAWDFAGVYVDDGISGTRIDKRHGFQDMLRDCEKGRIDIILTKSIQRFARNTVDLLETVRHLKALGIEVRFEKENISTLSGDGELMLTILASFAQEESRSISENVKWRVQKRFAEGKVNGRFRIYGYRWEGDTLVPIPEEAAIVKRIFQNFLDGKSRLETEREFAAEGITTRQGSRWVDSNIKKVLTNITYTGNLLLGKEYITDPIEKKRRPNKGERTQYFVHDTHEAIIDMDTFQYVQDEMARRLALGALANKSLNISCFTGKIKCGSCGVSYMHNLRGPRTAYGKTLEAWVCGSKKKKGSQCKIKGSINHESLKKALCRVLGISEFDEEVFIEKVDYIIVPKAYTIEVHLKDGTVVTEPCPNTGHKDCWDAEYKARASKYRRESGLYCKGRTALSGKLRCTHCGCNFRRSTQALVKGKRMHWRCAEHRCGSKGLQEEALQAQIAKTLGWAEWNDTLFIDDVDHIEVGNGNQLTIILKDGTSTAMTFAPPPKRNAPHTDAYKEHMRKVMKEKWAEGRMRSHAECNSNTCNP